MSAGRFIVRILVVCTANVCRSPSAQVLLQRALAEDPALAGIAVGSAGTHAVEGAPGCTLAPALRGSADAHRAHALEADDVASADLILAAAREHRSAVAELDPSARARTFTLRQAGRIATWMTRTGITEAARQRSGDEAGAPGGFPAGDPRSDVPPMPSVLADRWPWLVAELDAARAQAPAAEQPRPGHGPGLRSGGRARHWFAGSRAVGEPPADVHPDDVPDPHLLGPEWHERSFADISAATDALIALMADVAAPDARP